MKIFMAERVMNISENVTVTEPPFASVFGVQGYIAFVTVLLVLLVPPQLFLSIITMAGLCAGKEFKKIKLQRNIMIAMVGTNLAASIDTLLLGIAEYLFLAHHKEAAVVFCHGALLFRHIDYTLRDIFLIFFSVLIFIVIKHGQNKIRVLYFNITLFISILIALPLGIVYVFPSAVDFSVPRDGVFCSTEGSIAINVMTSLIMVLIFIPTRIITIGIVIASLVFMKKHITILTENKRPNLKIAMIKFVAVLVILNALFIVGGVMLVTAVFYTTLEITSLVVIVHLLYFLGRNIPPIVTPLLMIAVFKALRTAIKTLLLPSCCREHDCRKKDHFTPPNTPGTLPSQDV